MNSLVSQWIGLCAFSAKASGLIPNWRTKTPKATWCSKKKSVSDKSGEEREL